MLPFRLAKYQFLWVAFQLPFYLMHSASAASSCESLFACSLKNETYVDNIIQGSNLEDLQSLTIGSVFQSNKNSVIQKFTQICTAEINREPSRSISIKLNFDSDLPERGIDHELLRSFLEYYGIEGVKLRNLKQIEVYMEISYENVADNIGRRWAFNALERESCSLIRSTNLSYISNLAYTRIDIRFSGSEQNYTNVILPDLFDGRICEESYCIATHEFVVVGYSAKKLE